VLGWMVLSVYGVLPASRALGSLMKTASPGAADALTPGRHSSWPFCPVRTIAAPLLFRPTFLRLRGAASSEA